MRISAIIYLATALAALVPMASRAENVVRWTVETGMPGWEPTRQGTPIHNGLYQVYEGLTLAGADLTLWPALATRWSLIAPNRWRFELRRGVRFHDGTPLTAEDVAFSLNRARSPGSEIAVYQTGVATAIDEYTVEITTQQPDPLFPTKLRRMPIISKKWAEQHDATLPPKPGDTSAYVLSHANGTGPFMLESFEPGKRTVLVRNPNWWGRTEYPQTIDRIVLTGEPDPDRRLALLLDGKTDFLQDPPLDRLDKLRNVPGLRLARLTLLGTIFLALDQGSAELRTSDIKGRNPFADRRVRQALYQGIDVEKLIAKWLGGLGVPAGMLAAPGTNGYSQDLDRRLPYDPGQAKALLAQAGYPNGFTVRLDCWASRRAPCEGVAAQLAEIGVRMNADAVSYQVYQRRAFTGTSDIYLTYDLAGMTLDSVDLFHDIYYRHRSAWFAHTGYADPAFDALVEKIDGAASESERNAAMEKAWRTVLDEIVVIPLYHPVMVWAMRDSLDLPTHALGWPLFFQARVTSPR